MKLGPCLSKVVAAGVVAALQVSNVPVLAGPARATFTGRVLSASERSPLPGVQVHLGDPKTGAVLSSSRTSEDGSFALADVPPAAYEIAVQSGDKLFVVDGTIKLAPGETRSVQLAVRNQDTTSTDSTGTDDKSAMSWWNNPLVATMVVLGAAILIGVAVDSATSDDDGASPSSP